ncbi:MAG TPA: cobyrinic acid a,c-diamide synthase [Syntrophobacteraceae bacterium]|nr:cobyrinic acid a,c-diamide synthase [Syntrophobacteraceae bacterium]
MLFQKPRLVIAALRGGAGKTLLTLGLIAAWNRHRGIRVVPFKKGPDYIDAGWLALAAQHPCYNLDAFLMSAANMWRSFVERSMGGDAAVVEGNRGLFDGVDVEGSCSTAELAKLLGAPVVLVLDATKTTRTAAAQVLGCQHLDPAVKISGVILNRVAGKRHEQVVRGAIERYCNVPVLGVIPKEKGNFFPERHLGLIPPQEHDRIDEAMGFAADMAHDCMDLDGLWDIASQAEPMGMATSTPVRAFSFTGRRPVIGVLRDAAFQFYYPDNLEALAEGGAILVEVSALEDGQLPVLDALYIGGGFPETHLQQLAGNERFRLSLKAAIDCGLPVYAECGGLMFLCRGIFQQTNYFPMAGVFPLDVVMEPKPQGHGYTVLECIGDNPFFPKGQQLRGHEFHYSRIVAGAESLPLVFRLSKGQGIVNGWDGLCYKNTLASYTHLHALGNDFWVEAMVRNALQFRKQEDSLPEPAASSRNSGLRVLQVNKRQTIM